MAANTASPSVFDAGLPTIEYDVSATPAEVYPQLLAAQRLAPIALGPFGLTSADSGHTDRRISALSSANVE